ncbi:hypothetical protein BDZ85DRAFT_260065 [Elsinoe ampelina]|uniref:MYND-type domain-containing protein n=1 Tax=Elsinoe ampelina TaxID=302913 RepID=A0A6A6GE10_9PEZI|nr:hypothetical protein BDZ85DRAFT_260065 [Elsinoe ampelina]
MPGIRDYKFFQFPEAPFKPECGICNSGDNALKCARCKVQYYCSQDHQKQHFAAHKKACAKVGKSITKVNVEERKLRASPPDVVPPDLFEEDVGHFWGIHETRTYMRSRFEHFDALREIKTYESLKAQLDVTLDMLRLSRGDNMGIRDHVPGLMLQLHQDQEAYDFIKWWRTTAEKRNYDWGDLEAPYLDIHGADVFEPVDFMDTRFGSLPFTTAMVLLKIKLQLDIHAMTNPEPLRRLLPSEVADQIVQSNVRSSIITTRPNLQSEAAQLIGTLDRHLDVLFSAAKTQNDQIWTLLVDWDPAKHKLPMAYMMGSMEEAKLVLFASFDAWKTVPGAIEVVRAWLRSGK